MHDAPHMQKILAAARADCAPATWSRGVELSRTGTALGEPVGDPIEVRVSTESGSPGPTVTLWPEKPDWWCECPRRDEVCIHVATAVIALHRAWQAGKALPAAPQGPALSYRFSRSLGGLSLVRHWVQDGEARPLAVTLASLTQQDPVVLVPSAADLATESLLSGRPPGLIARSLMGRLLAAMQDCLDVQLDTRKIKIGESRPVMVASLAHQGSGMAAAAARQDPTITRSSPTARCCAATARRAIERQPLAQRNRGAGRATAAVKLPAPEDFRASSPTYCPPCGPRAHGYRRRRPAGHRPPAAAFGGPAEGRQGDA